MDATVEQDLALGVVDQITGHGQAQFALLAVQNDAHGHGQPAAGHGE